MNLGSIISSARKGKGIKQGVLANELDISQTYLSLIERNKKEPNISLLKKISKSLEIPLPLIFFFSLEEEDLPLNKRDIFNDLFPSIKDLIRSHFIQEND